MIKNDYNTFLNVCDCSTTAHKYPSAITEAFKYAARADLRNKTHQLMLS